MFIFADNIFIVILFMSFLNNTIKILKFCYEYIFLEADILWREIFLMKWFFFDQIFVGWLYHDEMIFFSRKLFISGKVFFRNEMVSLWYNTFITSVYWLYFFSKIAIFRIIEFFLWRIFLQCTMNFQWNDFVTRVFLAWVFDRRTIFKARLIHRINDCFFLFGMVWHDCFSVTGFFLWNTMIR